LYFIQISQTLKNSNFHEAQKTWNAMKLRKLIRKLKAQKSQAVALGWREIKKPIFLHKRNKWTQSDSSIKMDGVAT
jgi:ribosomal protein L18E